MQKHWKVTLKNGESFSELNNDKWIENTNDIKSLEMVTENGSIKLPEGMSNYIQAKTCSANLFSGECELESRYIGFIQNNIKFIIRVNEKTNNINIETQTINNIGD